MNQKNIFLTTIILISFFGVVALANAAEPLNPSITPDSPFYFLKTWKESIQTFFTFGLENKARQYLHLAEVRLAEYQKMIDKGKTKAAEKTLAKYERQLNRALEKAEQMKQKGKEDKNFTKITEEVVSKHLEVLEKNLEKAPEQAKKGLENAIEKSGEAIEKITGKPKKDETEGWKTYRNEEFRFEVKYPETTAGVKQKLIFQEFNPSPQEIFVGTIGTADVPGIHLIGFRIGKKPSGFVNLDTYLEEVKNGCQKGISGGAAGGVCNIKKIMVRNEEIPAIVSTESSAVVNTSVILYFDEGSDLFLVSYDFAQGMLDAGDAKEKILFDTIQKILSTFRFIPQ